MSDWIPPPDHDSTIVFTARAGFAEICEARTGIVEPMLATSMHNLGACLAHVGRELAAHSRWRLTEPEWDEMIAEISAGPPRKPAEAEAECDRIAKRIIAARVP